MSADSDELDYTQDPSIMAAIRGGDEQSEDEAAAGHSEDTKEQAPKANPPEEQSTESEGPDLSFLDDDLREKLTEELPPELQEILATKAKDYLLRQADYTRKTQALAEERKEAQRHKEAAEQWERLQADPQAIDLVLSYWKNGGQEAPQEPPEAEDPADILLDPAKFKAWQEDLAKRVREDTLREVQETQSRPQRHAMELGRAAEEWMKSNGKEETVVAEAVKAILSTRPAEALTPEELTSYLPLAVERQELRAAVEERSAALKSNSQRVAQARTASPRGGSGPGASQDRTGLGQGVRGAVAALSTHLVC